jgi:lambda family phage portal protein
MAGWNTPSSGPNNAIGNPQKIRDRARDVVRNDWAGTSSVRVWANNIIGTGIIPRHLTKDATLKEKLTQLWNDWVRVADADSVLDLYGLQQLVLRTWFTGGEAFIRLRPRRMADGLPVPLQIQVLEADMVPQLDTDIYPGLPSGNIIRSGIELNKIGQRVAYWFWKNHPGDKQPSTIAYNEVVRIPAEGVLHIYEPNRPGQLRGVSEMASIIAKLRNVADYDDAQLERQRLSNLFTLFITKQLPSGAADAMTGLPYSGTLDEPLAGMEPGIAQELLPGEDVKFSDPPDAGANYADFMRVQHLGVAAGSGAPYELISGDIKDVSDRTLRIIINEFRRCCEQKQWLIFIPKMCRPILDAWAMAAELSGALTTAEAVEARKVRWAPQGWAYIHPVQDVQAKAAEVEAGFRSRSSVITERGDDPDQVDQERADDLKRADKLGLIPVAPVDPNTGKDAADKKKQQDKEDKSAKAMLDMQNRILDLFGGENV